MIEDSPRGRILPVLCAIAVGVLLFVAYRGEHVHFSPQSRQCAIAAHSLMDRGKLELHPGRPYAIYGPLYPVLLAGLGSLGASLNNSIVILNSVALPLTLLTFYGIARHMRLPHPGWLVAFYAALATTPYLFRMARSDQLFVLVTMVTIYGLALFSSTGKRRYLLLAACACALATTARYMGVFPLAPLWAFVLLYLRRPRRLREWVDAAVFSLIAWIPVSLWLLRNKILTGHLVGMSRETWTDLSAPADPLANLLAILRTAAFDLLGIRVMGVYQVVSHGNFTPYRDATNLLFASVGIAFLIATVFWLVRRGGRVRVETQEAPPGTRGLFTLIHLYVLLYVTATVILWSWGNIDALSTRYVAPIYWGILILGAGWWVRLREKPGAHPLRVVMLATAIVIFAVNVDKSIQLFGEFPAEELIQKDIQQGAYAWIRNPTWEREAQFGPVNMKKRVVDQ